MFSNSWHASRLLINYLGIPYKTRWLSYPDIEPTFKELGIPPSLIKPDGSGHYSCPSITDHTPSGPNHVTDSAVIADYLVANYPRTDKPPVFPTGTKAAIKLLTDDLFNNLISAFVKLVLPMVPKLLDPRSAEYFHYTRAIRYGKPLDQLYPAGPERDAVWASLKAYFDRLASIYDQNDESDVFFLGDHITYADIFLASAFIWAKTIPSDRDGPDVNCVWDKIKGWNGGRWERFMHEFDSYLQVY